MLKRTKTKQVMVGNVVIGGQNTIVIQSMTTTKTSDINKTIKQINELVCNGAQLVRVAILDEKDVDALKTITKKVKVPIIADIHFNYLFAIKAIKNGAKKIRINPGNIYKLDELKLIVETAKKYHAAIRIGINGGSLPFKPTKQIHEQMVSEAIKVINLFELWGLNNIVVSLKHSNPIVVSWAYLLASKKIKYPLHIGVTEAGDPLSSAVKSSLGLKEILQNQIGDTIRISSNGDRINELLITKILLAQFDLYDYTDIIACPLCGRNQYETVKWVNDLTRYLSCKNIKGKIAIMGCVVNGLGEASQADYTLCVKSKQKSSIYLKGKFYKDVLNKDAFGEFIRFIEREEKIKHDKNRK